MSGNARYLGRPGKLTEAEYDKRIEALRTLERSRPLSPSELVQKGRAIQLGSGKLADLKEAEEAFQRALKKDEKYVPALIELGWFAYAVKDDARAGLSYFEEAAKISQEALDEAELGKAKCLEEMTD